MVEGARLESVCAGNRTASSNLVLSAKSVVGNRFAAFIIRIAKPTHYLSESQTSFQSPYFLKCPRKLGWSGCD